MDLEDRQWIAGGIAAVMAIAVPILTGLALLLFTGWIDALKTIGVISWPHDIHTTVWGWLTDSRHVKRHGHMDRVDDANTLPLAWFMFWLTAWLFYEAGEGVAWVVREFASLARKDQGAIEGEVVDPDVHTTIGPIQDAERIVNDFEPRWP